MKKLYAVFLTVFAVLVSLAVYTGKCIQTAENEKQKTYHANGYYEGYDVGYYDGYDFGYGEGYSDGSDNGWIDNLEGPGRYFEEDARHYAREHSGWTPEEAWMLIEAYQNQEPWYKDGSLPSEQDYLDAINSLIYFYDYFYSKRYD